MHWYDYATWVIYQSHFFVPIAALLVLWRIGSEFFRTYLAAFLLLTFMALGTYFVYPAQPPWMASDRGEIGPVNRVVHDVWKNVGVERAANVFAAEKPNGAAPKESSYSNKVAALPSLHAAYPMLLVCLAFALGGFATRRFALFASAAYLVAMGAALVYGGEHYIFDVLMGWAYATIAWLVARRFVRRDRLASFGPRF
jgi:membrane-associated phospholipid phosphatase